MMYGYQPFGGFGTGLALSTILVLAWSLFWKGLALWHSSKRNQPYWFIAMLLINTMGILEIIYLFGVAKLKAEQLFAKR